MEIKNKNIVITGGTDGIGLEVVKKLLAQEANVLIIGRNPKNIKDLKVKFYPCDLRYSHQIKQAAAQILKENTNIHALLNIAGIWHKKNHLENIDDQLIDDVIATNLTGLIKTTKAFIPNLLLQPEAVIINVSSRSGVMAQENQSVYCASKFGVYGFTEVLKIDLKDTPIKIAGVYQGGTNTKLFEKAGDIGVPYQTFTNPADLAQVIVFMLTQPKNIWISDVRVER